MCDILNKNGVLNFHSFKLRMFVGGLKLRNNDKTTRMYHIILPESVSYMYMTLRCKDNL